jgi:ABC-type transport system substrate-binding protein
MRVRVWTNSANVRFGRYFVGLLHRLGYRTSLRVVKVGFDYWHAAGARRAHEQIGWSGWFADFCSPSLDRKTAAALEVDAAAAEEAWADASRRHSELAPSVPLVTRQRSYFTSARLGNMQQSAMFGVMLERAWVR